MRESEPGGLSGDRVQHARMLVTETGHCGTTGGVEHALPVLADQPDAFTADRKRRGLTQAAVQDAASSSGHFSTSPCTILRGVRWCNRECARD